MINSEYIGAILDVTFDDLESGDLLRAQVPFLSEAEREYTSSGVFISFSSDKDINQYRVNTSSVTTLNIEGLPFEILNGVEIVNESLGILADTYIKLTNGIIDCLEIWNKIGPYPTRDPEHYELLQKWLDSSRKRTVKK